MPTEDQAVPLAQLLKEAATDHEAATKILPLVYDELRRLARARIAKIPPGQTIQATDLVHEAWLRLVADGDPGWESKAHFFGAAANAIRNILVDQARKKSSQKRDVSKKRELPTDLPELNPGEEIEDVLTLHEALEKLEFYHPRPAQVVTLRYFAGLDMKQIAEVMNLSLATIERDWRFARSWLQAEFRGGESEA